MIICRDCGHRHTVDAEFCAGCGRFLPWSGERVETPRTGARPDATSSAEAGAGAGAEVEAGAGAEVEVEEHPGPPHSAQGRGDATSGSSPDTDSIPGLVGRDETSGAVSGGHDSETGSAEVATSSTGGSDLALAQTSGDMSRLPVLSGDVGTVLRQPTEVSRVTKPKRRTTTVMPDVDFADEPSPDDEPCPECGQFNASTRAFCRRCGAGLAAPPDYEPMSFWHRYFFGHPVLAAAGTRPGRWGKRSSGSGRTGRWNQIIGQLSVVMVIVFLLFSFFGPKSLTQPITSWFHSQYTRVVNDVDVQYIQVNPLSASASSAEPNHPASLAIDGASNTWWQTQSTDNGVGQTVTVRFAGPTRIDKLGLIPGASDTHQDYVSECRPNQLQIVLYNGTKVVTAVTEHVEDLGSFQKFSVGGRGVTSATFTILSVYPSATGHDTAITELEFDTKV